MERGEYGRRVCTALRTTFLVPLACPLSTLVFKTVLPQGQMCSERSPELATRSAPSSVRAIVG